MGLGWAWMEGAWLDGGAWPAWMEGPWLDGGLVGWSGWRGLAAWRAPGWMEGAWLDGGGLAPKLIRHAPKQPTTMRGSHEVS